MTILTFTGEKYKYLHDALITAGYSPASVFVDGTTYTFNFATQEIADSASNIADVQCDIKVKHQARIALDAEYDAYNVQNMRAYMGAMKRGDTAMAATILAEGAALNTEYYTKKEALA
jgi:hypothetical protein